MNEKVAYKVSTLTIIVNLLLSILKLISGIIGKSSALISDGVHSASDVFSTIIVLIGIKASVKEADEEHPYGHERMESVAAIILSTILFITGIGIGFEAIKNIINSNFINDDIPTLLPLFAAILSIIIKEWMFHYTKNAAKKINSDVMMADAWHHRTDSLSSIGSFVGVLGARMGLPILDNIASIIICLFIFKAALNISLDALNKMIDKSCDKQTTDKIKKVITSQQGVNNLVDIKTRLFGSKIYVDIIIEIDGNMTLKEAHDIAENVHDSVEFTFPNVKHCMVHVNPSE